MKLNEICEVYSGYALKSFNDIEDGLPVVKIGNILTDGTLNLEECQYTTDSVNQKYYSQKGDIYIALSGATTGKIGIMDAGKRYVINQRVGIVRQKSDDIPQEYIKYFLLRQTDRILQEAAGCAQPNISPKQIAQYVISETSKEKMQKICGVLNGIKKIIDSRKAEISALDNLIKARFVEMFGGPATNPMKWKRMTFREASVQLSDGPFGSNLKSEHYSDTGIRVIRLGNIGVGKFLDRDKSFISEEHYEKIKKYTCRAGEIVIGTLGEPNFRACLIPEYVDIAVNKADCVHYVPKPDLLNNQFVCQYINCPETLQLVARMIHGQTRARVSSGQIANMPIFVPPMELQEQFADFVHQTDKSKVAIQAALDKSQLLFDSLMQKYFG